MTDSVHPEVLWAQRSSKSDTSRNVVYLTIAAPDVPKSATKLDIQPNKLSFEGKSTTKNVNYKCEIEFYEEVDPNESKVNHTDRDLELVLRKKKTDEEFWPRLLKNKAKVHWLKTDFDKWVDEDEQDPNDDEDWMAKAGGLGGEGSGFEGIDFSKFGAGPGGPGGPGGPAAGLDDSDDDELPEEDDDMPSLEGEEKEKDGKTPTASGIEEIE